MSWYDDKNVASATITGLEWNDMVDYIQSGIVSASTLQGSFTGKYTPNTDVLMGNYDLHTIRTATFNSEYLASSNILTSTFSIDWNNGQKQKIVVGTNTTLSFTAPSGPSNLQVKAVQSSAGSKTLGWPTMLWPGAIVASLTTTSNAVDIFSIYYDGTNYYCVASQDFR